MIYLKENPVGVDYEIQRIQEYIYEELSSWKLEAFGRAEVNEKTPLVFYKKNDYKNPLMINENYNGRFFFVSDDTAKYSRNRVTSKIDVIFLLNIEKSKQSIPHRADEEAKQDILNVLSSAKPRTDIDVVSGLDALKDFETKLIDRQPFHFIKYSFEINYNKNKC